LEVAHAESDPHNIAAFNALLELHKGRINAAGWLEVAQLYMALLGHKEAVPIKGETIPCSDNECSLSFSDRPIATGQAYNKWTLSFTGPSKGHSPLLTDISKESVQP
jgi:hypothetical protein